MSETFEKMRQSHIENLRAVESQAVQIRAAAEENQARQNFLRGCIGALNDVIAALPGEVAGEPSGEVAG